MAWRRASVSSWPVSMPTRVAWRANGGVPPSAPGGLPGLADLQEVPVRVAEEAADLPLVLHGRGEELGATGSQRLIRRSAVPDPDGHFVTRGGRVGRRGEGHSRLVLCGPAPLNNQSHVPTDRMNPHQPT